MKKAFCILIVLAVLFSFSACRHKKVDEAEEYAEEKEYSYAIIDEAGEYTDRLGNRYNYIYRIPAVTIETDDAKLLNRKIYAAFYPAYGEEAGNMKKGLSISLLKIGYKEFYSEDILSLLVTSEYAWEYTHHEAYSINVKTGKRVTSSDFQKLSGLAETEFLDRIRKAAENKFIEIYGSGEYPEYILDVYNYTVSDEAVNMDIPMFLGENGNLYVSAKIGSVAGAEYYEYILDSGIKVIE